MNDGPEPSYEAALTIGDDIHALTQAVQLCVDAVRLVDDEERRLTQEMRLALESHWNILASLERRYRSPS